MSRLGRYLCKKQLKSLLRFLLDLKELVEPSSARYPDLNTSSKASSGAAISKSKSLGHEASKTLFEKDKAGEQIYNVHVAKKTSKKIAQLAVNIPLPGLWRQRFLADPSSSLLQLLKKKNIMGRSNTCLCQGRRWPLEGGGGHGGLKRLLGKL